MFCDTNVFTCLNVLFDVLRERPERGELGNSGKTRRMASHLSCRPPYIVKCCVRNQIVHHKNNQKLMNDVKLTLARAWMKLMSTWLTCESSI